MFWKCLEVRTYCIWKTSVVKVLVAEGINIGGQLHSSKFSIFESAKKTHNLKGGLSIHISMYNNYIKGEDK